MSIVIVLGKEHDEHAQIIMQKLEQQNVHTALFDTSQYPINNQISWDPSISDGVLKLKEAQYKFSEIKSIFWRSVAPAQLSPSMDKEQQKLVSDDSSSMLRTFLEEANLNWVNSYNAIQFHKVKPRQLALAKKLGAQIPKSIIGNHPQQIIEFMQHTPKAIYKPVFGGAHTALVSDDLIERERLDIVTKLSPITIQEYICGANVRTYVVGDKVFSAEIHSDEVDFRSDSKLDVSPINLSDDVNTLAKTITQAFGMQWSAIDWRMNADGELVFLEANPSPMFIHFENVTGYPISDSLTELLIA